MKDQVILNYELEALQRFNNISLQPVAEFIDGYATLWEGAFALRPMKP